MTEHKEDLEHLKRGFRRLMESSANQKQARTLDGLTRRLQALEERVNNRLSESKKAAYRGYLKSLKDDVRALEKRAPPGMKKKIISLENQIAELRVHEPPELELNHMQDKLTRMEDMLQSPVFLKQIAALTPLSAILEKRIATMEKPAHSLEKRVQFLESRIRSPRLEKRLARLESQKQTDHSSALKKRFDRLEATVRKELKNLVPTTSLDRSSAPPSRAYESLLKEIEKKRRTEEQRLYTRIKGLEQDMSVTRKSIAGLRHTPAAPPPKDQSKDIQATLTAWTKRWDAAAKQRIDAALKRIDTMHVRLDHMNKEVTAHMHDLDVVIAPLSNINKKIQQTVEREIKNLPRPTISPSVLRRELSDILNELESRQSRFLEAELRKAERDAERLKRVKL